jgi:hypothetical protein
MQTQTILYVYFFEIFGGKPGFPWHPWLHTTGVKTQMITSGFIAFNYTEAMQHSNMMSLYHRTNVIIPIVITIKMISFCKW